MYLKKIRHLLEYGIFYLVMIFIRFIGLKNASNLFSFIGRKIAIYLPVTNVARQNIISTIGKNYSKQKTDIILDDMWDNFGRYIAEFPFAYNLSEDFLEKHVSVEGMDNIEYYRKNNIPFILCLGHFANWDFLINILNKFYPKFSVIYRKANNPYVDNFILNARSSTNIKMIAKGRSGARDLIKSLKEKRSIAMLVDQKMNDGIEVAFLGRPAMTASAVAKISIDYNYPIIPCQIIRTGKSDFKLIIKKKIDYHLTGEEEKDIYDIMLKINNLLGEWVIQNPGQWFWFHKRWK